MAYPNSGNRHQYFEPICDVAGTTAKPMCSVDIGASNGTHGEFVCVVPCRIIAAKFSVTLENVVGTTTAPYVVLTKYTTPGAGGTATVIGTITVPTGTAIGSVIYKKNLTTALAVGDVVQIKWVVGTGGSVAGQGNIDWYCEYSPESEGNNTDLAASST